jgi:hypothetical protein
MNSDTASLIFVSIMATGVAVWLWSLIRALRLGLAPGHADRFTADGAPAWDTETGELAIRGERASLSKALVRSLRQPNVGMFGAQFRVTEQSSERLSLEKTGPLICNQPAGLYFSEAELSFVTIGDGKVRVSYRLGYARLVRLFRKISLCIIFGAGLPTILIVGLILWFLVVRNENPTIRWQVFQTFQIVHVLWPPFLFMWLYSLGRRRSRIFMENLIASVEALD